MQELKASFLDENSHLSTGNDDGFLLDETTQSSLNGSKARNPLGNFEMNQLGKVRQVTAETLFEYRWPLEGKHSEHYFLQEQVTRRQRQLDFNVVAAYLSLLEAKLRVSYERFAFSGVRISRSEVV